MQILKKGFSIFAAVCLLLEVMPGQTVRADETTDENGFTVDDSGTLVAYSGAGGAITIPESVCICIQYIHYKCNDSILCDWNGKRSFL